MSSDAGSARNTLASQCSTSSSGSTDSARRRREYWKKDRKIVRILTVLAYIVSVSTAAVLLSAYYVFLWNPKPRSVQHYDGGQPRVLTLAMQGMRMGMGPSQESPAIESERPLVVSGRMAASSFALSASQVDLKVGRNSEPDLNYVKTNTKVYQQRQIPTPQSTVMVPTTEMPTASEPRPVRISSTGWPNLNMEVATATSPTLISTMNPP